MIFRRNYETLGEKLLEKGKPEKALEAFDNAISLGQNLSVVLWKKGNCLVKLKKYDEALKCYQDAINADPEDFHAYYYAGQVCYLQQNYQTAIEYFNKCTEDKDGSLDRCYEVGHASSRELEADEWHLSDKWRFMVDGGYLKGLTLILLNKFPEACDSLQTARGYAINTPHPTLPEIEITLIKVYVHLGKKLLSEMKYEEALNEYDKALRINPNHYDALCGKGACLLKLEKYDEALKRYQDAISVNPGHYGAYHGAGVAHLNQQHYHTALEYFNKALEREERSALAWNSKGAALTQLRKFSEAREAFHIARSYAIDDNDQNMLSEIEGNATWLKEYEDLLDEDNPNLNYLYLGGKLLKEKKYEEAIQSLDTAISLDQDPAFALCLKGNCFRQLEKYDEALKCYQDSIDINPGSSAPYYSIGQVYLDLQKYEAALEYFNKTIDRDERGVGGWYLKGITLLALRQYPEALDTLHTAHRYAIDENNQFWLPTIEHTIAELEG